ncbi:MAG: retropepsin-like aspartic protease [Candidatus Omnitrophota bacterium]
MKIGFYQNLIFVGLLFGLATIGQESLYADTLFLKNGRKIDGIVKAESSDGIELEVCGGSVRFKKSEIERVVRGEPGDQELIRIDWERQKQRSQEKILKQQQEQEGQPERVEFARDSLNITLMARLNDRVDAKLVMDTGSTLVVLKKEIAEELKIKLDSAAPEIKLILADGRQAHAKLITLKSVKVENVEAKNVEAAVMLDDITDPGFQDGLLGMSFLKRFNFKVDNREKKLILERL